jgi:hypothetical protein
VSDWISDHDGPVDQVRRLHTALARHEREMPVGVEDAFWADRVIMRNTLDRVGTWLPQRLDPEVARGSRVSPRAEAEAEVIGVAWNVPWERARRDRILRVFSHADMQVNPNWLSGIHLRNRWRTDRGGRLAELDRRCLTLRRAVRLQVAVRLYQLEHTEPLQRLAQLVPAYLPEVPVDPYTEGPNNSRAGQPFRYRLSAADSIEVGGMVRTPQFGPRVLAAAEVGAAMVLPEQWGAALAVAAKLALTQSSPAAASGGPMVMSVTLAQGAAPPPPKNVNVARGSGIIWSVGPDRRDDGGTRTPRRGALPADGQDWVFIVPPPRATAK